MVNSSSVRKMWRSENHNKYIDYQIWGNHDIQYAELDSCKRIIFSQILIHEIISNPISIATQIAQIVCDQFNEVKQTISVIDPITGVTKSMQLVEIDDIIPTCNNIKYALQNRSIVIIDDQLWFQIQKSRIESIKHITTRHDMDIMIPKCHILDTL